MSWRRQSVFILLWAACAFAQAPPQHKVALLTNGRSIAYEQRKNMGAYTRLYTREGYIEIPTTAIRSFKNEDHAPQAKETPVTSSVKTEISSSIPAPSPAKAEWSVSGYRLTSAWVLTGAGILLALGGAVFLFTRKRGAGVTGPRELHTSNELAPQIRSIQ